MIRPNWFLLCYFIHRVKNEKAQYLAALESLRRCEDQLTVEKVAYTYRAAVLDNSSRIYESSLFCSKRES